MVGRGGGGGGGGGGVGGGGAGWGAVEDGAVLAALHGMLQVGILCCSREFEFVS